MKIICENAIAYIKFDASSSTVSNQDSVLIDSDDDNAPVIRHLGNGMLVVYVVNNEDGLFYIHHHHLKAEGIDADQLHQIGMQNLIANINEQLKVHKRGAIYTTLVDGNFEASLVLIDDLWEGNFKSLITNDIIIAMPERSVLAFCDSKSAEGIASLREVIRRVFADAEHPLSSSLFIRHDGAWVAYK